MSTPVADPPSDHPIHCIFVIATMNARVREKDYIGSSAQRVIVNNNDSSK